MKKVLIALLLATFIQLPMSYASVEQKELKEINLSISYPLIYLNNAESQDHINSDIASFVYNMKNEYDSGGYYSAYMKNEITYEDNDVISIVLHNYTVRSPGAAHGFSWDTGLVYSKLTGERIPLSNYVNINSPEQLQRNLLDGVLSAHSADMKRNYFFRDDSWAVKKVSNNYILGGNGIIYLLYAPYNIGPYSAGTIRVKFTPQAIDYFKRTYNS